MKKTTLLPILQELLPALILWGVFFAFGLWLRQQIPLDVPPGELHGFDYNGHGALFADYRNILFTRFRHPLFGWLMSPIFLFGARFAELSASAFWGFLVFVFSGLVAACVWLVYRLAATLEGVGKIRAAVCAALFAGFGYVRYLAACPESFPVSMLLALAVLWWGVKSPFLSAAHGETRARILDRIVWGILFVLASGITLTQGVKVVLAYLAVRRLTRREGLFLAACALALLLAGGVFYGVKLAVVGSGSRTVGAALAELFSCIPQDLSWGERLRMLEMFFCEPIVPHGVSYAVSEIKCAYPALWPKVVCAVVYSLALAGAWRLRKTPLLRMMAAMFCVDVLLHLVLFWGMKEAQIYCGHWFYILPLLMAGAFRRPTPKSLSRK